MAPFWIASPPEVHSALLSSGPGPGALLAAAGAWQSLSAEYADAIAELSAVLGATQGAWQGPSAAQYAAAHVPYLAWLTQAQTKSDAAAAQHEAAASAYTAALAMMPTLAELGTNHVLHGVLVATNFFGLNTIPIAVNEADYTRMWLQAATAMSVYEAVSDVAMAAVPPTEPAPAVLKSETAAAAEPGQLASAAPAADAGSQFNLVEYLTQALQGYLEYVRQLFAPITDFLQDPIGNTINLFNLLLTNPSQAFIVYGPFLSAVAYQAFSWVGSSLTYPQLLLQPLLATTLGIVAGVGQQLLDMLVLPPLVLSPLAPPAAALAGHAAVVPVAGLAPTTVTSAAAPAASAAAGAGAPAPASAAPAAMGPAVPYAIPGMPPDGGFTPTLRDRTVAKAPSIGIPAAAAAVSAKERRSARRRRAATMPERQYGDEFMDYDGGEGAGPGPVSEPAATSSSRGAGAMGFGGIVEKGDADAAGLITLPADDFGGGPVSPMLPTTWDTERPD